MSKKKNVCLPKEEFEERIREYHDKETLLLKSLGMVKRQIINFPKRKVGIFTKLLIQCITWSGGILDTQFFNIKK